MLRDETTHEPRRALVASRKAALAKLRAARLVAATELENATSTSAAAMATGVALVGDEAALGLALDAPAAGLARLRTSRATARRDAAAAPLPRRAGREPLPRRPGGDAAAGARRVGPGAPGGALLVVSAPPVLSTLGLYAALGFRYAAFREDSWNALPAVVDRLESAVKVWHHGFPWLTYADAHVEDTSVRVAYVASEVAGYAADGLARRAAEGGVASSLALRDAMTEALRGPDGDASARRQLAAAMATALRRHARLWVCGWASTSRTRA